MKHALPLLAGRLGPGRGRLQQFAKRARKPTVTQIEALANDALLTTEVKAKLITVDINSAASLGVRVANGVATLPARSVPIQRQ